MEIHKILVGKSFGNFSINAYLLIQNKRCIIIDPGDDEKVIKKNIKSLDLTPVSVMITHAHIDHIKDTAEIAEFYKIPVYIHEDEKKILESNDYNLSGVLGASLKKITIERYLKDNEEIEFEGEKLKIIHTPGHTPGGMCIKGNKFLISGDTLFANSWGRTDFPYGDEALLMQSIKEKLFILEDDTVVYPGHEGPTTIGNEKRNWGMI